ncbi:MAG: PA14 domain-containing protein, partial [Phycisphaeraceae bacterium]|nr:PA14 domain-containing protein [Phycisphaeraceae bacterium]
DSVEHFDGGIYDFRIYQTAFSPARMRLLASATLPKSFTTSDMRLVSDSDASKPTPPTQNNPAPNKPTPEILKWLAIDAHQTQRALEIADGQTFRLGDLPETLYFSASASHPQATASLSLKAPDGIHLPDSLGRRPTHLSDAWTPRPGTFELTAAISLMSDDRVQNLGRRSIRFTVEPMRPWLARKTGRLNRRLWTNVEASSVHEARRQVLLENLEPTQSDTIFAFWTEPHREGRTLHRVDGYLLPPVTGPYLFHFQADDQTLAFVSSSKYPQDQVRLVPDKKVHLTAGRHYRIDLWHLETKGQNILSVGWTRPDRVRQIPIPPRHLSHRAEPEWNEGFVNLRPEKVEVDVGTHRVLTDDSVLLGSKHFRQKTQIHFRLPHQKLTALRLIALPDERIPGGGPGLGIAGLFKISELRLFHLPGRGQPPVPLAIGSATDDQTQSLMEPSKALDQNPITGWGVRNRPLVKRHGTFVLDEPLKTSGDLHLLLELDQSVATGRLLVQGTATEDPKTLQTPTYRKPPASYKRSINFGYAKPTKVGENTWEPARRYGPHPYGYLGRQARRLVQDPKKDPIAHTALQNVDSIRFRCPNGTYAVRLYFVDQWRHQDSLVMNVWVEDEKVIDDFDIASRPPGELILRRIQTEVTDGELTIRFQGAHTFINAVAVESLGALRYHEPDRWADPPDGDVETEP